MPVIYLVRHGQASFGTDDYDVLSPAGREQAEVTGAELAWRGLRDPLVVCGTLNRQRDTAEILMTAAGLTGKPETDPRWNEYDHLGLVDRYPRSVPADDGDLRDSRTFQRLLDQALATWIADGADGADRADGADGAGDTDEGGWHAFSTGAMAALTELAGSLGRGRDAVVVTSGGVLAAVCAGLLGAPAEGFIALNRVTVNASITTVLVGGSGISLSTFNEHAHFAGERRTLLTYR